MSYQTVSKSIAASFVLSEVRHLDPEIDSLLSAQSGPDQLVEYFKRRYGDNQNLVVRVSGDEAELKWIIPTVDPEAENSHREALALARQKDFAKAIK